MIYLHKMMNLFGLDLNVEAQEIKGVRFALFSNAAT
jgi:hypothetical protein